jgi:hypothetical protein
VACEDDGSIVFGGAKEEVVCYGFGVGGVVFGDFCAQVSEG